MPRVRILCPDPRHARVAHATRSHLAAETPRGRGVIHERSPGAERPLAQGENRNATPTLNSPSAAPLVLALAEGPGCSVQAADQVACAVGGLARAVINVAIKHIKTWVCNFSPMPAAAGTRVPVARRVGPPPRGHHNDACTRLSRRKNIARAIKHIKRNGTYNGLPLQCTARRAPPTEWSPRRRVHWGSPRRLLASAPLRQRRVNRRVCCGRGCSAARGATKA